MVLGLLLAKSWTASSSGLQHGAPRPAPSGNCAHYSRHVPLSVRTFSVT